MSLYANDGNCWFYGGATARLDLQADAAALRAGATSLRPGEVVVRVDGGEVVYVLPEAWFTALRANLALTLEIMARSLTSVSLRRTALHHNVCLLPDGAAWDAYSFGNLMGGGSFLAGPVEEGSALAQLSGMKLSGVQGKFGPDGTFGLTAWKHRPC